MCSRRRRVRAWRSSRGTRSPSSTCRVTRASRWIRCSRGRLIAARRKRCVRTSRSCGRRRARASSTRSSTTTSPRRHVSIARWCYAPPCCWWSSLDVMKFEWISRMSMSSSFISRIHKTRSLLIARVACSGGRASCAASSWTSRSTATSELCGSIRAGRDLHELHCTIHTNILDARTLRCDSSLSVSLTQDTPTRHDTAPHVESAWRWRAAFQFASTGQLPLFWVLTLQYIRMRCNAPVSVFAPPEMRAARSFVHCWASHHIASPAPLFSSDFSLISVGPSVSNATAEYIFNSTQLNSLLFLNWSNVHVISYAFRSHLQFLSFSSPQ